MKKYISLAAAAGLVIYTVIACTPSPSVTDNPPPAPSSIKPSDKPKDANITSVKTEAKTDVKAIASNPIDWQDYKSSAGKFSIQMPSKPKEQSQEQGTVKLSTITAEANDSGYFIAYADFPEKVASPADVQKGLTTSVKSLVENIKGEIKSEQEYLLDNVQCRDFEAIGKVQSTDVSMKGRFCLADSRIYQIFALGAKDKFSPADVDRFVTSFKIDK